MGKVEQLKEEPDKKMVTIYINGTATEWGKDDEISFEQVVAAAFPQESHDPLIIFKVTYERAHGNKDGILNKGDSVKVKEGMLFDATNTGRS